MARYISPALVKWRTPTKRLFRKTRDGRQREKVERYVESLGKFHRKYQQIQPGIEHEEGAATRPNTPVSGSEPEPAPQPAAQEQLDDEDNDLHMPKAKRGPPSRRRNQPYRAIEKREIAQVFPEPTTKTGATAPDPQLQAFGPSVLSLLERLSTVAEQQAEPQQDPEVQHAPAPEQCPFTLFPRPYTHDSTYTQPQPPVDASDNAMQNTQQQKPDTGSFPGMPASWFSHQADLIQQPPVESMFTGSVHMRPAALAPHSSFTQSLPSLNQTEPVTSVFANNLQQVQSNEPQIWPSRIASGFVQPQPMDHPSIVRNIPSCGSFWQSSEPSGFSQPEEHQESVFVTFTSQPPLPSSPLSWRDDIEMNDCPQHIPQQQFSFIPQPNFPATSHEHWQRSHPSQFSQPQTPPIIVQQNAPGSMFYSDDGLSRFGQPNQYSFRPQPQVAIHTFGYSSVAASIPQQLQSNVYNPFGVSTSLPFGTTASQLPIYNTPTFSSYPSNPHPAFAPTQPFLNPFVSYHPEQPSIFSALQPFSYQEPPVFQKPIPVQPDIPTKSLRELVSENPPLDSTDHFQNLHNIGKKYETNWDEPPPPPAIPRAVYKKHSLFTRYTNPQIEAEAMRTAMRQKERRREEDRDEDRKRKSTEQERETKRTQEIQQREQTARRNVERRRKIKQEKKSHMAEIKWVEGKNREGEVEARRKEAQDSSARYEKARRYAPKFEVHYRSLLAWTSKPSRILPSKLDKTSFATVEPYATRGYATPHPISAPPLPSHPKIISDTELKAEAEAETGGVFFSQVPQAKTTVDVWNTALRWCTDVLTEWNIV